MNTPTTIEPAATAPAAIRLFRAQVQTNGSRAVIATEKIDAGAPPPGPRSRTAAAHNRCDRADDDQAKQDARRIQFRSKAKEPASRVSHDGTKS